MSHKTIADSMNIGLETVRFHIKKIHKALEFNNKITVIDMYQSGKLLEESIT